MNMHAGAALSFFGDFLSRHNVNFILDLDSSFFPLQLHHPAISLALYPAALSFFFIFTRLVHHSLKIYTAGYTSFLYLTR